MTRLAAALLARVFGAEAAASILGDLEEELANGRAPRWAHRAAGSWLLWQAVTHAAAARWAGEVERSGATRISRLELGTMWYDVRDAIRSLRAAPTFTIPALVVLALAIGATTAIVSVVDAVVLRALPYDQPDRLVQVGTVDRRTGTFDVHQPPQNFVDWEARQEVFAAMAATTTAGGFTVPENGVPRDLRALQVTSGYFDVYRVIPQVGRGFTRDDEVNGGERVALISDGLWRRQFGADPNVVGRTLRSTAELAYGAPFPVAPGTWTIVGVMPRGFRSPAGGRAQVDVWIPYAIPAGQHVRAGRRSDRLEIAARLRDGVTVEDAAANIEAITGALARTDPAWFEDERGAIRTLHQATVGDVRRWMLLLLGAVTLVLVIACVNVGSLQVARGMARTHDIRVRATLGASRWRITRGLLIESLVLAAAGLLLGLTVGAWATNLLRAALPADLPRVSTIALDLRVLTLTALASLSTAVLAGLAPALHLSRRGGTATLRSGQRTATGSGTRLRSTLVVSEIALAVVLTIGGGLFVSSFVRAANVDLGLDPNNVLTVDVWPRIDASQPDAADRAAARSAVAIPEILARVAAIPGVVDAGFMAGDLPLTGYSAPAEVVVPDRQRRFDRADRVQVRMVTPRYARAVGTRVVRGRYLEAGDIAGSAPVVVLNEAAAARYLGDRDPIGAAITIERGYAPLATVVGVVANVRLGGPESPVRPEAYLPAAQGRFVGGALAVRTAGNPLSLAGPVRAAIRASFPEIPEPEAETMDSLLGGLLAERRFNMLVVGLFAGLALAIAGAGLYGVMAYSVAQRTREIGVRLALGARPGELVRAVIGRAAVHTIIGVGVGLTMAWGLASWLEPLLFGVRPHDPAVYAAAAGLLALCGIIAAFAPARRAARVDPVVALRVE